MNYGQIIHRTIDDSYVITKNGMPYHVYPYAAEFAEEWDAVFTYAEAHPEMVTEEKPYVPTLEEAVVAAKLRRAKERRALSVSSAVVEIDGLVFNASLDSIYRMNAVLFAAQLDAKPDSTVVQWVMADNVVRAVSLRQLSAAYIQAVERLVYDWPEVYTELNK